MPSHFAKISDLLPHLISLITLFVSTSAFMQKLKVLRETDWLFMRDCKADSPLLHCHATGPEPLICML